MNIVDIIIVGIIIIGLVSGIMKGLLPQLVSLASFFIIIVGSFILKNPLALIMYEKLPFFNLYGVLKGASIINILFYEIIAFIVCMIIFSIVLKLIFNISKIIEKAFRSIVILEIPSKIFGGILGMVENYLLVFIILYIASIPFFNIEILKQSKLREPILDNTPIINNYAKKTVDAGEEIYDLIDKYKEEDKTDDFNLEALDVLLKYNITTVESIDKLVERKKISINNIDKVLSKYRNDNK